MKVGAGILGILWSLFAFTTWGFFLGGLGALGDAAGDTDGAGTVLKMVGLGLPALALAGGIISFGQGTFGGLLMLASGAGFLFLTQANFFGLVFGGPLCLAGILAMLGQRQGAAK